MTTGQRIINNLTLSVEQADGICYDLDILETTGVWHTPDWAKELAEHYQVCTGNSSIQLAGWKAVAKTYKLESLRFCARKGLDGSTVEINDDEELPDYGMGQEASYYEDMRRKNEKKGKT